MKTISTPASACRVLYAGRRYQVWMAITVRLPMSAFVGPSRLLLRTPLQDMEPGHQRRDHDNEQNEIAGLVCQIHIERSGNVQAWAGEPNHPPLFQRKWLAPDDRTSAGISGSPSKR